MGAGSSTANSSSSSRVESRPTRRIVSKQTKTEDKKQDDLKKIPKVFVEVKEDFRKITDTKILAHQLNQIDRKKQEPYYKKLQELALKLIDSFSVSNTKTHIKIIEILPLATVDDVAISENLLTAFIESIKNNVTLNIHMLDGLAVVINKTRETNLKLFNDNNLVQVMKVLKKVWEDLFPNSERERLAMVSVFARLFDAMTAAGVTGIDYEELHKPIHDKLRNLQNDNSDKEIGYEAAYTLQSLLRIPDSESTLEAAKRKFLEVASMAGHLKDAVANLAPSELGEAYKAFKLIINLNESHKDWYQELRHIHFLFQYAQLEDAKKFIEASNNGNQGAFAWGVVQQFVRSLHQYKDPKLRMDVLSILAETFLHLEKWGNKPLIQETILKALLKHTQDKDAKVSKHAQDFLLKTLRGIIKVEKNFLEGKTVPKEVKTSAVLWEEYSEKCEQRQEVESKDGPRVSIEIDPDTFPTELLIACKKEVKVPPQLSVKAIIEEIKSNVLEIKETMLQTKFIELKGRETFDSEKNFDAKKYANEIVNKNKNHVLLITGTLGSGKSRLCQEIYREFWLAYKKGEGNRIPLFLSLGPKENRTDCIEQALKQLAQEMASKAEFNKDEIEELKKNYQFLLILDDYDALDEVSDVYKCSGLEKGWDVNVIVVCRSVSLPSDCRYLAPPIKDNQQHNSSFSQLVVQPLSGDQVILYINSHLANKDKSQLKAKEYIDTLTLLGGLGELTYTPYFLWILLEITLELSEKYQLNEKKPTNDCYQELSNKLFQRLFTDESEKLRRFNCLPKEGRSFPEEFQSFANNLAKQMKKSKTDIAPPSSFISEEEELLWKDLLAKTKQNRAFNVCPLKKIENNQYVFLGKILLEHCVGSFSQIATVHGTLFNSSANAPVQTASTQLVRSSEEKKRLS